MPPNPLSSGSTEEIIGRWMAARGCRARCVIATKVAGCAPLPWISAARSEPADPAAPPPRLTAEQIKAACDASLRRMQIDAIDLYQLHWPDRVAPVFGKTQFDAADADAHAAVSFEEQVRAMGELIAAGKIRFWGVSNETPYGLAMHCETAKRLGVPLPVSIQNDFSLLDRRFEAGLAEVCHAYGVKLLAYGALNGGALTDKYYDGSVTEGARHRKFATFQSRYHAPRSLAAGAEYRKVAQAAGISLAALALRWAKSRWYMGSVIFGATSAAQLRECLNAYAAGPLSAAIEAEIEAIHVERRNPNATD